MAGDQTEQQSLQDYPGSDTDTPSDQNSEDPPSVENTTEFLEWLKNNNSAAYEEVLPHIPDLIDLVHSGGYDAWTAGNAITYLLNKDSVTVDCPDLVSVLDDEHIDVRCVIEHILEVYPQDKPVLESSIGSDIFQSDDLTHRDRMEGYRALSRLPPDKQVYSKLQSTAQLFDGDVTIEGDTYPLDEFHQTYAMRCLQIFLRYPDRASQDLAEQAIKHYPWASLRVVTQNIESAVDTRLIRTLTKTLDGRAVPSDVEHGRIVPILCEIYTQSTTVKVQKHLSALITTILAIGIYPTQWQDTVEQVTDFLETGEVHSRYAGNVLASILEAVSSESVDDQLIENIILHVSDDDISPWVDSIEVLARTEPNYIVQYVDSIVSAAQSASGLQQEPLYVSLDSLSTRYSDTVLSAIEPLVSTLPSVKSAHTIEYLGEILHSLQVYPPPLELFELYGSVDEEIDTAAKNVVSKLRRQFKDTEPAFYIGKVDSIEALIDQYSIVKRTGPVTWESPSLNSAEISVINAVSRVAVASENAGDDESDIDVYELVSETIGSEGSDQHSPNDSVQLVTPTYDPKWIVLAALGAISAQLVNPNLNITLHTPATDGWGTKKDIKEELQQYALSWPETPGKVIPLVDLVPTARVTSDGIEPEVSGTTISDDPPTLALTRNVDALMDSSEDLLLCNYLPGIDAENAAHLTKLKSNQRTGESDEDTTYSADSLRKTSDASLSSIIRMGEVNVAEIQSPDNTPCPLIELYSLFTTQHAGGRRRYVGPPTDLETPVLPVTDVEKYQSSESDTNSSSEQTESDQEESEVELYAIKTQDAIGDLLETISDYAQQANDPTAERALRGFKYTIGSLPVPVDLHDTWVQNQMAQGNTWVPQQIHHRRDRLKALSDEVGFDAELLDEALVTVDTLLDRMAEANPLTEELLSVLDGAAAENKRVGILCSKKTYKDMLDLYLKQQASDWALGDDLHLLDVQTVRDIAPTDIDWLVSFDALPPQTAIYYHHPEVEKTVVLGHNDDTLEQRVYGIDSKRRPYLPERAVGELPELNVTTHGRTKDTSKSNKALTEDLYKTYLSVASRSQGEDGRQSNPTDHISQYRIEFSETDATTLRDTNPVIVESDEHLVSAGEFGLRSLSRVTSGDEIVHIDPETRRDLWEEFLRKGWDDTEDELDTEEAFIDAVELWIDAISSGLRSHSESGDLADGIWDFAREIAAEITVEDDAVADWGRSVSEAESPSDLVFRSELRIGPQNRDGVKVVAERYGCERMAENWEQVFTRIKTIRTTHRKQGRAFWEWLGEQACDGDLFDYPGVRQVTVSRCLKEE